MKAIFVATTLVALFFGTASADLNCKNPCTTSQCQKAHCTSSDPYACVSGIAVGGCAVSSSYFSNTSLCQDCCDISGCALTCGPCSAEECMAEDCPSPVPFICTGGADKDGCAASASAWKLNPGCSSCCDSSTCPSKSPAPGPTVAPPVKLNCKKSCGDMCKTSHTCGASFPYMCIKGNETDGCKNTDSWTSPGCEDCCDVTMCPTTSCGKCTPDVCRNTKCSFMNPYICTGGSLDGGCSDSASYWPANPNCQSCCDLSQC